MNNENYEFLNNLVIDLYGVSIVEIALPEFDRLKLILELLLMIEDNNIFGNGSNYPTIDNQEMVVIDCNGNFSSVENDMPF